MELSIILKKRYQNRYSMCGITALFGFKEAPKQAAKALAIMKNRGKDYYGIFNGKTLFTAKSLNGLDIKETSNVALGHCLHAIVGTVPQPLINKENKSTLITNCEIYNWEELNSKYSFQTENDAELLHQFLDKFSEEEHFKEKLTELDGVFAFVYQKGNKVIIARDILGIKPVHFSHNSDGLAIASEQKALETLNLIDITELNPRTIIKYNKETNVLEEINRKFFEITPEHKETKEQLQVKTQTLLDEAIKKRIPKKKIALLFSGGIDSTYIAHELKRQGVDFTCYTAAIDDPNSPVEPEDLVWAKKVAKELDLNLKIKQVNINEIPKYLKHIVPLIEDNNVVKVSVALTFYLASELAKEDNCRVIFSGLGSEEIFAGYQRHKDAQNINKECLAGLRKIYERDLYRDDVLTMDNMLELRVPFLDHKLVKYALKIPEIEKIVMSKTVGGCTKKILREIAIKKGIPEDIANRKKRAAQYGSRTQQALKKLSKQNNLGSISDYLSTFYQRSNLKLGILFSGGKDSTRAAEIMHKQNYKLSCLIYLKSTNEYSYMFQSAGQELISIQAKAMQIPLIIKETAGEKEAELEDLKVAIQKAKKEYKIDGVVSGALFSNYQRDRIEIICDELGLKIFAPLWHKSQEQHMKEILSNNTKAIITAVAADGLDENFLGRQIDQNLLNEFQTLHKKVGFNIAGEGGEFESLVLDSPLFKKRIHLVKTRKIMDSKHSGKLLIDEAELIEK